MRESEYLVKIHFTINCYPDMNRYLFSFLLSVVSFISLHAQIQADNSGGYLSTNDGKPFFWLGDTAWEMFHRLTREEIDDFLETRRLQGFNVIQAVALAEFNGLHQPNRYGDLPLLNDDPRALALTPGNDPSDSNAYDYWDHVDYAIDLAAKKGMYIGLLPTWGDKVAHLWGDGPLVFNASNAEAYARTLAKRYANRRNVIWILGGDRPAVYKSHRDGNEKEYDDRPIWRAMAKGIENVLGSEAFITYHPWGGSASSSQYLHEEQWLDMNTFQSGHGSRETPAWDWVTRDLKLTPHKPTMDMEPCYEDHPVNPWDGKWTRQRGYFSAYDVRARIYRGVFAGGCGVTYGHHEVWQFLNKDFYEPINIGDTLIPWRVAIHAEAAGQMQFLKNLVLSRPYFSRIADDKIIVSSQGETYLNHLNATRDANGTYAMIYLPQNHPITINMAMISGKEKNCWWYDPRNGHSAFIRKSKVTTQETFTPPANGKDWVLVIDDATPGFKEPGKL